MNERDLSGLFNSSLVYDHLIKNKCALTAYLEDGVKISGRLLGWDQGYLIILADKTLQIVPMSKLSRLQAELENIPIDPEVYPELVKPKFTPEPAEGNDIKDQLLPQTKPQDTDDDGLPAKDRLDNLVKNW
jgi:hypothetical protein